MIVMATLRFSYGTMGSGKSTLALQIHHNMSSRGVNGLLLTKLDRDGSQVTSRLGVSAPAIDVSLDLDLFELTKEHMPLQFLVCDETQFYSVEQCDQLESLVSAAGAWVGMWDKLSLTDKSATADSRRTNNRYKCPNDMTTAFFVISSLASFNQLSNACRSWPW